jgi:RNA polymerase sigma-70 factor (sigma-E family)
MCVGTDEEFIRFARESQRRLLRYADLLCGDHGRAEDLVQDALIKTYLAWSRVQSGDPEAYARKTISHAHIDWWRRRPWRERPVAELPEVIGGDDSSTVITQRDAVQRALAALTRRERMMIALRYYYDMSEAEIAAETGCARGTVKSATARALAKLKKHADIRSEAVNS